MKKIWMTGIVFVLTLSSFMVGLAQAGWQPESRQAHWEKVEKAINEGLPKTAIKALDPIIEGALKDGAHAEAIRAIGQKVALEGNIQGNKPEEKIVRFEDEIARVPEKMQPVMRAVLANWYWHYFQHNRWRFTQRTATSQAPGEDITTWDLTRIFAEIDKQYSLALEQRDLLRSIPVKEYNALLKRGTMPDRYRPSLYDFVVAEALTFYSSGEQAGARPQDAFVLSADRPIFAPLDDFLAWKVETTDTDSAHYKGIKLYQELLDFHQQEENADALLHHNLQRLRFGYNHAVGETKNANYKAALKRYIEQHHEHELSSKARESLGSVLEEEGEFVRAREIALQGHQAFPTSIGGRLCLNLVNRIIMPEATLHAERVWNDPKQEVELRYRNLTNVHFRLISANWERELRKRKEYHPEQFSHSKKEIDRLLDKKPAYEWSAELPATEDFQFRTEAVQAPAELKPGFYWLVAAHDPEFEGKSGVVALAPVWVSDLAIVWRSEAGSHQLQGMVLDARNGTPIEGAEVETWSLARSWNKIPLKKNKTVRTDAKGLFRVKDHEGRNRQYVARVRFGGQMLATGQTHYLQHGPVDHPDTHTTFFTDRALYRPGQTIHFKGIHYRMNRNVNRYHTLPNQNLTVTFRDGNRKEIAKLNLRSNDYGSFSGSFTAPRDRLMGQMYLETSWGQSVIRVEEYKRPTFKVEVNAPTDPAKLHGKVHLKGTASAYTGAPTDGALVRWRVVRETRYPDWWYWRCWWLPPQSEAQEIAHGVTQTDVDGSFGIEFVARPAPDAEEEGDPSFRYTLIADVTDTAGETRSSERSVIVGFTALEASLSSPSWLEHNKPFELSVFTRSLDGVPMKAKGTVSIYSLVAPETVHRGPLQRHYRHYHPQTAALPKTDHSNPTTWERGPKLGEQHFQTDEQGRSGHDITLPVGVYRAVLETTDAFGKAVRAEWPLRVIDPAATSLAIPIPHLLDASSWTVEPGEEFTAVWGSGYKEAQAYVEIEHRGKLLQAYWSDPGASQINITQPVNEALRGGFHVRVTFVHENRAYLESRYVQVPWNNKQLTLSWERFTSKLKPGQEETWAAVIKGPDAEAAASELVATLYDQSLDAFNPHTWISRFNGFYRDQSRMHATFENSVQSLRRIRGWWNAGQQSVYITYRSFPHEIVANLWGYAFTSSREMARREVMPASMPLMESADFSMDMKIAQEVEGQLALKPNSPSPPPKIDLDQVTARKNLQETAFFFPHLTTAEDGSVRLEFTMPEALTEWKFLGFAHDANMRSGLLTGSTVTAKDLMVQPNPPRFLREGDILEFTVRVTNQSAARQEGTVRLSFADARTLENVNADLKNTVTEKPFDVPAKESRTLSWRIEVPDEPGVLIYRAVGSTGRLSDGEEGYLPVLSRRILVNESIQLPIRGPETKTIRFEKLLASGQQKTLESKTLTVQMVSNPAWYAVLALPYLMEYPHQCSEQVFNRLYANQLAGHIAHSDPKIRHIFNQWKGTDALDSPMEKNEDLKSVMLEETPWVRQAEAESQARRNVGILFDENRLKTETRRAYHQLKEMQLANGAWPWFPGGRPNDYITLYVATGFARLRHLGAEVDPSPAIRSLDYLDHWMYQRYLHIQKWANPDAYAPSPMMSLYLYTRSFYLEDRKIKGKHQKAFEFFVDRAKENWLKVGHRKSQAHLALALHRLGEQKSAKGIMRSIKERAVTDEELGMFWREQEISWWWFRAPIETQAMMIEAFDEVMNDKQAVEECRVWLLKQKQTQDWKTTKATADAVYGLLLRGSNALVSDELVEVRLGGVPIKPENVEAGTGFYEKRFTGPEIAPQQGHVTLVKKDKGVAWGGLHWQYLEDIANITPHDGTPLSLEKALYLKQNTPKGPTLVKVDGPVEVGDELVSRIVLRTDRDMEYVHLKDYRGSGTEPVNVLSGYRSQDGLLYYESTRDTASHFFIDYLPKGTYVFEYSVRVQHRGSYQTGIADVQCMYAPEFSSHSGSVGLTVE